MVEVNDLVDAIRKGRVPRVDRGICEDKGCLDEGSEIVSKVRILQGDVMQRLGKLSDESVHCAVTSPPYWGLRDYGMKDQLGLEKTPELYIEHMVGVFREVRRVLRNDGTFWLNMGDCYAAGGRGPGAEGGKQRTNVGSLWQKPIRPPQGLKPKDLVMMSACLALALQADGWWIRKDIIWHKPNPMPESIRDRPTKAHEYLFLLTKSNRYFYDQQAVKEPSTGQKGSAANFKRSKEGPIPPGQRQPSRRLDRKPTDDTGSRNLRSVWVIPTQPFPGEFCKSCKTYYPKGFRGLKKRKIRNQADRYEYQCPRCKKWRAWLSHYATFPERLVEPCIKAGTSEKGCCPKCGAPWVRLAKRIRFGKAPSATKFDDSMQGGALSRSRQAYRKQGLEGPPTPKMLGWEPPCKHKANPVPCVVLDPFLGAGTTALVAARLGRDCIGIELHPDYCEMAKQRIKGKVRCSVRLKTPPPRGRKANP